MCVCNIYHGIHVMAAFSLPGWVSRRGPTKPGTLGDHWCSHLVTDHGENMAGLTCKCLVSCHATNKPKENPQQPETKACNKHATSEICLLPSPSYSKGRACEAQSQHKHFIKTVFATLWQLKGQYSRSSCEGFSQRTAARPTLYFIYLTYIIHISYVLYITYTFYNIFSTSPSSSSSSTSISPTSSTYTTFPSTSSTRHTSSTTHTHIASLPTSSSISLHPLHYLHILYLHPASLTTSSSSSTT